LYLSFRIFLYLEELRDGFSTRSFKTEIRSSPTADKRSFVDVPVLVKMCIFLGPEFEVLAAALTLVPASLTPLTRSGHYGVIKKVPT